MGSSGHDHFLNGSKKAFGPRIDEIEKVWFGSLRLPLMKMDQDKHVFDSVDILIIFSRGLFRESN